MEDSTRVLIFMPCATAPLYVVFIGSAGDFSVLMSVLGLCV